MIGTNNRHNLYELKRMYSTGHFSVAAPPPKKKIPNLFTNISPMSNERRHSSDILISTPKNFFLRLFCRGSGCCEGDGVVGW